ncbi:hypothetical protein, partial [Hoylesella timonensis]|uniref:hypothetical protein n=1 Tax=Hoylesella timonensis TaxID=386414 RepID=UPI002889B8F5
MSGLLFYLLDDGKGFHLSQGTLLGPLLVKKRTRPVACVLRKAFLAAPAKYHALKFKNATGLSFQFCILVLKFSIPLLKFCILILKFSIPLLKFSIPLL